MLKNPKDFMAKDKVKKEKKKKPTKLEKKLEMATEKVIKQYGDVLKKLGKT